MTQYSNRRGVRYGRPDNGPLAKPCPKCEAPIGWRCARYGTDDNGNRFVVARLKHVHRERKTP